MGVLRQTANSSEFLTHIGIRWAASREKGPDDMTRDFEKFAFENNCSKWREIWVTRAGCSVRGENFRSKGFGMPKKQTDVPFRT